MHRSDRIRQPRACAAQIAAGVRARFGRRAHRVRGLESERGASRGRSVGSRRCGLRAPGGPVGRIASRPACAATRMAAGPGSLARGRCRQPGRSTRIPAAASAGIHESRRCKRQADGVIPRLSRAADEGGQCSPRASARVRRCASPVPQVRFAPASKSSGRTFPRRCDWSSGVLEHRVVSVRMRTRVSNCRAARRRRHAVLVEFGRDAPGRPAALHAPLAVASTAAVGGQRRGRLLLPAGKMTIAGYLGYVASIVEGENSFLAKREIIDEYGWRNFGDLYADHEAVHHDGRRRSSRTTTTSTTSSTAPAALPAHRRAALARAAGRCWRATCIDIDIYHTSEDKAGLQRRTVLAHRSLPARRDRHASHLQPAQCPAGTYGGGPSNEHNYTTGLLHYHS